MALDSEVKPSTVRSILVKGVTPVHSGRFEKPVTRDDIAISAVLEEIEPAYNDVDILKRKFPARVMQNRIGHARRIKLSKAFQKD